MQKYYYRTGELIEKGDLILTDYGNVSILILETYFEAHIKDSLVDAGAYTLEVEELVSSASQNIGGTIQYEITLLAKGFKVPLEPRLMAHDAMRCYPSGEEIQNFDLIESCLAGDKTKRVILFLHKKALAPFDDISIICYNTQVQRIELLSLASLQNTFVRLVARDIHLPRSLMKGSRHWMHSYHSGALIEAGDCIENIATGDKHVIYALLAQDCCPLQENSVLLSSALEDVFKVVGVSELAKENIKLIYKYAPIASSVIV